jgi:1,4-alpha-glucan branching enzyme
MVLTADNIVARLATGALRDPFDVFGMHEEDGELIVRVFLPWAKGVEVVDLASGEVVAVLQKVNAAGLFAGGVGRARPFPYRLKVSTPSGTVEIEDVYRFRPVLGEIDIYLLAEGSHIRSYDKLGAHLIALDGVEGVGFAVWAPNARSVDVVGAFNDWDGRRHPMRLHPSCGVWDLFFPGLQVGQPYKFEIHGPQGELLPLKADPYALQMERAPGTASVVGPRPSHAWRDEAWLTRRWKSNSREAPISIYEAHLGSWRRKPEEGNRYLSYRELADQMVPYVADLGFSHIEIMPPSEYPFDGSWGYQPLGLFAPTNRFGTPDDFRYFVDACHQAGLALWIDWVAGHFPTDAHGLAKFDGTHLYEHADPRQGFNRDWNTLVFNYGRREVSNYLISNALSWLERFHVDGLRVDAVSSMLYLDYSRNEGEWIPNQFGGRENLEAIQFLRRMNELVFQEAPGATTVAEESTAWPMVSMPPYVGGLGFGFKWNMGWMHDTLRYMSHDPVHRKFHHNDLTFGLLYGFSENFILPLSHDEVVHGKGSILGRMPGDRWQRFANLRAYYGFMWSHPGKKLLFMGSEFGQEREWNHDNSLDWHLLDDPLHHGVHQLVRDLNRLYRTEVALHRFDASPDGFAWIDANDNEQSCLAFLRRGSDPREIAVIVCNFTPVPRQGYRIGVPWTGRYVERLNTDAIEYGGSGMGNRGEVEAERIPWHGHPQSLTLTLPPLSTTIFVYDRERN